MTRCLITGAAGFVASNLVNYLKDKKDYDAYGIDNMKFGSPLNIDKNSDDRWEFSEEDFNNLSVGFLDQFDVLVHMATANIIYAQNYEIETYLTNAINTIKLFQKFKGRVIYTSTASVYNNAKVIPTPETEPTHTVNSYDSSKLIAELFLQERGNYTTLRLENVYGINQRISPYCGVIGRMIGDILNGYTININGDGLSTRSYSWCVDVSEAIFKAIEHPSLNTEINIGSGSEISAIDLAKLISKEMGVEEKFEYIPNRKIDTIYRRCLDIKKAKELLDWSPTISLEQGIKKTIEWQKGL